jgi:cytochrome c
MTCSFGPALTRRTLLLSGMTALLFVVAATSAQAEGDARRGAEQYGACVSCHSLETGSHLTGPSLAGLWGRQAGQADGFIRYSQGLSSADFTWSEDTLNAWLADPQAMIPGTYMVFRGIADGQARADLVAFLKIAMPPDGAKAVVEQGLAPADYVRGQKPDPLGSLSPDAQVTKIRHCRDSYFVTTADGIETPYWEMNVRLKLDTRETGPELGKPAILGAGMAGDRVSIVFSSLEELTRFVAEGCP